MGAHKVLILFLFVVLAQVALSAPPKLLSKLERSKGLGIQINSNKPTFASSLAGKINLQQQPSTDPVQDAPQTTTDSEQQTNEQTQTSEQPSTENVEASQESAPLMTATEAAPVEVAEALVPKEGLQVEESQPTLVVADEQPVVETTAETSNVVVEEENKSEEQSDSNQPSGIEAAPAADETQTITNVESSVSGEVEQQKEQEEPVTNAATSNEHNPVNDGIGVADNRIESLSDYALAAKKIASSFGLIDDVGTMQLNLETTKSKTKLDDTTRSIETSSINGRIFDSDKEKEDFHKRKGEMKYLFEGSSKMSKEERLKTCQGKCGEGMFLFTVWTTAPDGWNSKYTRSIDSALFHHPKAKVAVFSSSLPDDFLDDFKTLGYDVEVEPINLKERAKGSPMEDWAARMEEWKDGPFFYAHLSDATRLVVLYQQGGVYFDTDVVFVNPMDGVTNVVGWERADSICNAMMAFEKNNAYIREVLTQFNDHYIMNEWAANGPLLLTDLYQQKFTGQPSVHPLGKAAFYLISWTEVHRYFDKSAQADVIRDNNLLKKKSYAVHFWNSRSHDLVVHPTSLMAKLFLENCVLCKDISDDIMDGIYKRSEGQPVQSNAQLLMS